MAKTIHELAQEVLLGKWGSGNERKNKIKKAGYDYSKVQNEVNKMLAPKTTTEIAKEVLNGEWGSGDTRKKLLKAAGFNYEKVQNKVNELSKQKTPTVYQGILPTVHLVKSNAQVIADTIAWAIWIASDNTFHYGYTNKHGSSNSSKWSPNAHHNGCYFCGTNTDKGGCSKKGIVDYKHTYCCNPFVGAAWAHGGCVPKAIELCHNRNSWDFHKGAGYDKSSLFDNLGHPAMSKLKKGDVLCKDNHVALYIGNGKIVEAAGGDDNKKGSSSWNKSIRVTDLTSSRYKGFKRVHRYNGKVNTKLNLSHGEYGDRVAQWQAYLDWYFDGQVGKPDKCFGDNTLKWTKKFQEEVIGKGQGDGVVGEITLAAAMKIKK